MPPTFWAEARKELRPKALSIVIELGEYLMLWAMVLAAHLVRIVMAAAGIEPEIVNLVAWVEKWVFLASFGTFFLRILMRLYTASLDALAKGVRRESS